MFHLAGSIQVAPKLITWVGIPVFIDERERLDLLKKDTFLYECQVSHMQGLTALNSSWSAFVFNLDAVLKEHSNRRVVGDLVLSVQLAKFIVNNHLHYCLVHTTSLDPRITQIFYEYNIPVLQRDLQYRSSAWSLLEKHIMPVFRLDSRAHREFIRLKFLPEQKVMVALKVMKDESFELFSGYVDNLSLNGFAVFFTSRSILSKISLKDVLSLKLQFKDSEITISSAIVTRIDRSRSTIGVSYNIDNQKFIKSEEAIKLSKIIYNSLRQFNHSAVLKYREKKLAAS